ncbi:MAG: EAL domain-containing protein [Chromatiales bacterium]|jgi:diguanylate cyclase (GGDEF)-like protein
MTNNEVNRISYSRLGRFLVYAAGPLLVGYLVLLLGTTYVSQQNLREANRNELHLNIEKRAAALSYFYSERIADITTLIEDQTLYSFFSNRALGMSMEYGLRASLLLIRKRFEKLVIDKQIDAAPVYLRLLFIDRDNEKLVDVGEHSGQPEHWTDDWIHDFATPRHQIFEDHEHFHMLLIYPYLYKGERQGTIIAEINHQAVFNKLVQQHSEKSQPRFFLTSRSGLILDWNRKSTETADSSDNADWTYPKVNMLSPQFFKVSVPGTPFYLAVMHPKHIDDFLASPWYLYSLGLMALLVLLSILIGLRTQSHNLILRVKFDESEKQSNLLHQKNQLLEREIEKRQEYEQRLAHQANYDSLTELPNRTLALDRLSQALSRAQRTNKYVVGMFIDLDRFKNVNDTLGHDAGDLLLQQAAQRLKQSIRGSDTAARLGGDEFMILLPDIADLDTAESVCIKIIENFSHPFSIRGQEFHVSASIGVAIGPDNGEDAQTLMKCADLALYQAKEGGRDTFRFFTKEMNQHAKQRQSIETQLIRALEKEEFYLHYQPIFDLKNHRILGAEALIRWFNPVLGHIPPNQFIPLAEESGLIAEIGDWVLHEAVSTIKQLGPEAARLRIAINISCRQLFRSRHFQDQIESLLSSQNFPAPQLELEITERLLLEEKPEILQLLYALHEQGVRLVVDDFGTGFSALSYLKKFPLDGLKVDQSFIRDVLIDSNDASLTKAIIAIAHELGMEATGEGVETREQARFLQLAGCDTAQGYYFGRPADAIALHKLLNQQNAGKPSLPHTLTASPLMGH